MADIVQCKDCGAILADEDVFCGECGAPRPSPAEAPSDPVPEAPQPKARQPEATPTVRPAVPQPRRAGDGWRIAVTVIVGLSLLAACGLFMLGVLLGFVIPDPDTGQAATESMIYGAGLICFCPGALALILAVVLWAVVLRKK